MRTDGSPRLSICIPTYNRSHFLRQLLASIRVQDDGLLSRVEVIISDNCSSDETLDVVNSAMADGLRIRYTRTDTHISANDNFKRCVMLSEANYVWCVGDDDLLARGCLAIVLYWIDCGKSYVILNSISYLRESPHGFSGPWFRTQKDLEFDDAADAFKVLAVYPGFISAVVAERRILAASDYSEEYAVYGWNQLFSFYSGIIEQPNGVLIAKPFLIACRNSDGSYDWERYFIEGLARVTDGLARKFRCYSTSARSVKERVLWCYIITYVYGRRLQGFDVTDAVREVRKFYGECKLIWLAEIIGRMPRFFLSVLDIAKCAVKRALFGIGKLKV